MTIIILNHDKHQMESAGMPVPLKEKTMTILIPTDFNDNTQERFFDFLDLLEDRTKIVLFHSVEAKTAGSTGVMNMDQLLYEEAEKSMALLVQKINDKHQTRLTIDSRVLCGYFDSDLEMTINTVKPNLIVLISKSRKGIDKLMDKRKTLGLIGEIKPPVLVIPEGATINQLHKIGFAIDQKEPLTDRVLNQLSFFTSYFKSALKTFHVNNHSEGNQDYYHEISTGKDFTGKVEIVLHEDIKAGIDEWMHTNEADALAIVTHNKNFFEKLFKSSVTRKLIKENKQPILILTQ
ncbi:MAG: hypothetical protein ABJG68_17215 [Crocinitomicaceae bacterium]